MGGLLGPLLSVRESKDRDTGVPKPFRACAISRYLWPLCWILPKVKSKKHKGTIFKQGDLVALQKVMGAGRCLVRSSTSHMKGMKPIEEHFLLSSARLTHHIQEILREGKSNDP